MLGELFVFFFFQAEDGIRDYKVTGVQTCALPISFFFSAKSSTCPCSSSLSSCGQVRKGRRKAKMSMDMWTILRFEKRGRPRATADGAAGEERSGMSSFESLPQAFLKRGHAVAKFPRRFRA